MEIDKIINWKGLLWISFLVHLLLAGHCTARTQRSMESKPKPEPAAGGGGGVRVNVTGKEVVLDNGILQVTFQTPEGYVTGIRFGGLDNVLDATNRVSDRGYWDIASASNPDSDDSAEIALPGTTFKVITQTPEQAEISFFCPKSSSLPLQVDIRYVMLRGSSGFYSYAIFSREKGYPPLGVDQIRTVYKLNTEKFRYMAVSDKIQRVMPMMQDRDKGKPLAYKEAVYLTSPVDPKMKGEVDDKYQYAVDDKDNKVHGWVSSDPPIGVWMITPTDEFRMGGPMKRDLTSHTGPNMLAMFHSTHYGGPEFVMKFNNSEPWKKVFGPYFVHLNTLPGKAEPRALWKQAQDQLQKEVKSWPYSFPASVDFPKANQRGSVSGRLLVKDGDNAPVPANLGWVGLTLPGEAGSWQYEMKGYQFWTQTDKDGKFTIANVNPGEYNFFAWVPGYVGDFKSAEVVNIAPGKQVSLGDQTYSPPRSGPTLWEIGIADRSAAEFFVPDPNPELTNPLFLNDPENKFRQYGLWDRYADLYPKGDLVYTVGTSDYKKDWFFAHVLRKEGMVYHPTTWQIVFPLKEVAPNTNYTLQIALAGANQAELQVRVNNPDTKSRPTFTTLLVGRDNSIARHGIHGVYKLFSAGIPSSLLKPGQNTFFLTQSRDKEAFRGLMYDYLRLEGPSAGPAPKKAL